MIDSTVYSRRVNVTSDAEPVEFDSLAPLGTAGGLGWFRFGDRELRIDRQLVHSAQLEDRLRPDERYVHRTVTIGEQIEEAEDGKRRVQPRHAEPRWYRASVLERGSFDKACQADERRAAALAARKAPKPIRPIAVETPPALAAKPEQVVPLNVPTDTGDVQHDVTKDVFSPFVPRPLVLAGKEAIKGRAVLAWVQSKGIRLGVVGGRLLASSSGGAIATDVRAVLRQYRELLRGWVSGRPVGCTYCSAEATTLAEPDDAPLCDEHGQAAQ
jgi:hypothetical protein